MGSKIETYYFDNFRLESSDKMLYLNEKTVSLTPKMFEILLILLESQGKVVEKDELMQRVWHDRFVEENNLTYNIKMLRKTLGDDAKNPKFIETIPRRGYRFVGNLADEAYKPDIDLAGSVKDKSKVVRYRNLIIAAAIIIFSVSSIIYATMVLQQKAAVIPVMNNDFNLLEITNTGSVGASAISPNGSKIAYTNVINKSQGVWIYDTISGKNTNLIEPFEEARYFRFRFSADGNYLFFAAIFDSNLICLYRISISDGKPVKLIEDIHGEFGFSPDFSKVVFIRNQSTAEINKLFTADIDGKNEKLVSESEKGKLFRAVDYSFVNQKVVASFGNTNTGSSEVYLAEIDIETGEKKLITSKVFFHIRSIAKLKDNETFLIAACERADDRFLIWKVEYKTGIVTLASTNAGNYKTLTLDNENTKLSAVTVSRDFSLYKINKDKSGTEEKVVNSNGGFDYTKDGRIVYSSSISGSSNIWIMNQNGTDQKQLTNGKALDDYSIVSPDNQFIYFSSNRTGEWHIWRMNLDGSEQTQITKENGGFPVFVSPDNTTLYYQKDFPKDIWKISLTDGKETEFFSNQQEPLAYTQLAFTAFAPDGKAFAVVLKDKSDRYRINLLDVESKTVLKSFPSPFDNKSPARLTWIPNTNSFAYVIDNNIEKDSLWIQDVDSEKPNLHQNFFQNIGYEEIQNLRFSPDGNSFMLVRGNWKHDVVLITGLK